MPSGLNLHCTGSAQDLHFKDLHTSALTTLSNLGFMFSSPQRRHTVGSKVCGITKVFYQAALTKQTQINQWRNRVWRRWAGLYWKVWNSVRSAVLCTLLKLVCEALKRVIQGADVIWQSLGNYFTVWKQQSQLSRHNTVSPTDHSLKIDHKGALLFIYFFSYLKIQPEASWPPWEKGKQY